MTRRRPGDQILDRYAPDLTPDERETAHERLRSLANILIQISERLERESTGALDSTQFEARDRIPPTPLPEA